jgi:hypothetical protein
MEKKMIERRCRLCSETGGLCQYSTTSVQLERYVLEILASDQDFGECPWVQQALQPTPDQPQDSHVNVADSKNRRKTFEEIVAESDDDDPIQTSPHLEKDKGYLIERYRAYYGPDKDWDAPAFDRISYLRESDSKPEFPAKILNPHNRQDVLDYLARLNILPSSEAYKTFFTYLTKYLESNKLPQLPKSGTKGKLKVVIFYFRRFIELWDAQEPMIYNNRTIFRGVLLPDEFDVDEEWDDLL